MRDAQTVSAMLCPVCKTGLAMSDRQGVEIDYCPQCRGVWLDRGELDKVIERSGAGEQAGGAQVARPERVPSTSRPDRDYSSDDDGRYATGGYRGHHDPRRKRSFLSELFD